jgi:pimeloyl-ACP methyl ester carboxylesterase
MVADYIHSRAIGSVTLIGHSYGGSVALLAAQEQALVSDLILIGTPAFPQKKPPFMRILQLPLIGPLFMSAVPARLIARRGLEFAFHRRELIRERHISRYAAGYRGYSSARALANIVRQMIPADFNLIIERYKKITLPVLLIWGEHDRVVTHSTGKKLHDHLPLSQLVVLPGCGHNPHEEQPEAAFGAIRNFLAGKLIRQA